ncbi:MAG: BolA/IbaG family iron-sulfur metabolism protein [Acidihalobacter sp.]|jgi:acid stress-induced BolA-like protein IbaG/YrbA
MNPEEIKTLIEAGLENAEVEVTGEGGKYEARVVSPQFTGLTTIKRHQLVYATVRPQIDSGAIHALSIRATLTPEEAN